MSLREEQCKKVCRILDDVLANRPTERDSLIVAVRKAFESLEQFGNSEPLPSAQPEINCSEFPNNSDTISRQDAVSRRRLLSDLKELITAWEKYPVMAEQIKGVEVAIGYVELIPSTQPERKKGKWINSGRIIRCNKCKIGYATVKGMKSALTYNFCPNCGADMRGEQDE